MSERNRWNLNTKVKRSFVFLCLSLRIRLCENYWRKSREEKLRLNNNARWEGGGSDRGVAGVRGIVKFYLMFSLPHAPDEVCLESTILLLTKISRQNVFTETDITIRLTLRKFVIGRSVGAKVKPPPRFRRDSLTPNPLPTDTFRETLTPHPHPSPSSSPPLP